MTPIQLEAYLERISYKGPQEVSFEALRGLQAAHMLSIPFENLDIHLNVPLQLDFPHLFDKIVVKKRGGGCYEVNGLLYFVLESLGFNPQLCLARLIDNKGNIQFESVHMAILIEKEKRYLADVGQGEGFLYPLCLDETGEQPQQNQIYKCQPEDQGFIIWHKKQGGRWKKLFYLTLEKRDFKDFENRSFYHQTSMESPFSKERICIKPTETGCITLRNNWLTYSTCKGKSIRQIMHNEDYRRVLNQEFGLKLEINMPLFLRQGYLTLRSPRNRTEWENYHRIRREQIHEKYCACNAYNPDDKEERQHNCFPLVLTHTVDQKIIGTLRIDVLNESEASFRWIAVDKPYQRQGFGKKMIQLAESLLHQFDNIKLIRIPAENVSQEFYSRLGYQEMPWPNGPQNAGSLSLGKDIKD